MDSILALLGLGKARGVSLARASLLYEWKRFLPAVLAVAFSGLLVLVQFGLLLGIFSTVSVVVDRARADLWVGFPGAPSFDLGRSITQRHEMSLRMEANVTAVEPLIVGYADWRGPRGNPVSAVVVGVEPTTNSLGMPDTFTPQLRLALQEPDAIVVDVVDLDKLGVQIGDVGEINGKRAKIVGVTTGFRNIGGAYMFCSVTSARRFMGMLGMEAGFATYLLVGLRDPTEAAAIRARLQPSGPRPQYSVWTAPDFSKQSQLYWLTESGAGASFAFSSMLGLIVGIVVTSQTLMGTIVASLREYATLRALGVPRRRLSMVVLEQSVWVGLAGLAVAATGTAAVWLIAKLNHVGIVIPWWSILGTAFITLAVAVGSGLYALRALFRAQPAELLR